MMRFLFFGAGAIGCAVGGKLSFAGHDVTLIARPKFVEAIRERGIVFRGIWGEFVAKPKAFTSVDEIEDGEFDAVFITTKSYDTENACKELSRSKVKAKVFITMQNGLGNLEKASKFFDCVAGAVVTFGSVVIEPAKLDITVWGQDIMFGEFKGESKDILIKISEVFSSAGLPSRFVDDILTPLWLKVTYNCALNPLSAIFRTTYGEVMSDPSLREIGEKTIEECIEVAKAEGRAVPSADDFKKLFFEVLLPQTASHTSSMVQDISRGKRTEIDSLCGEVFLRGQKYGVDARTNWTLWKMVKALENKSRKAE